MKRIKDGFRLVGQSWQVIREEPALIAIMGVGLILQFSLLFGLSVLVIHGTPGQADFRFPRVLLLYPVILVSSLPGAIAGATVAATAMQRLEGRDASVREGFKVALSKWKELLLWVILLNIVGAILQVIAEKLKLGGRLLAFIGGVSWAIATMFVIPVLIFEDKDVRGSIKRSGELVKSKWGEGVTGKATFGLALVVVLFPVMMGGIALVMVDPVLGGLFIAASMFGLIFVGSTLGGVFNVALYRYAATGEVSAPFTKPQLDSTFITKEQSQTPRRRALRIVGFIFLGLYLTIKVLQWTHVFPSP